MAKQVKMLAAKPGVQPWSPRGKRREPTPEKFFSDLHTGTVGHESKLPHISAQTCIK